MLINRWSKSLSFKMFVHKSNFLQLSLKINAIFSIFLLQQKLALVISYYILSALWSKFEEEEIVIK